jgi:hypothetical protein
VQRRRRDGQTLLPAVQGLRNFFVLEVQPAWVDAACKVPRTLHHRGRGVFMVAGETIRLPSRMK